MHNSDALDIGRATGQQRRKGTPKHSIVCINHSGGQFHLMLLAEEEEEDELGEPLILRIDQDDQGSVGSEDTSRFDSDDDLPLPETGQHLVLYFHFLPKLFSKKPSN